MADEGIWENLRKRQAEIWLDPREVGRQIVHALARAPCVTLHEIAVTSTNED